MNSKLNNWFENNQTKSIIIYTLTIAAATWACLNFVLDENRINLYRAQKESVEAENRTLEAKLSVYSDENSNLRADRDRYLSWLQQDTKSIPFADKQIAELKIKVNDLESQLSIAKQKRGEEYDPLHSRPYLNSQEIRKGSSFLDDKTEARLGINMINADYTASGSIFLPGKGTFELKNGRPGQTFEFIKDGMGYKLTIEEINYISDTARVSIKEAK